MEKLNIDGFLFSKAYKVSFSWKISEKFCVMTLKVDAEFKEKPDSRLEKLHKEFG